MGNNFIISIIISIIYFLIKFLEIKFTSKEEHKSLKDIFKDTLVVYFGSIAGLYIVEQISPIIESGGPIEVFTDNPNF
jgi:hypothetical protein